MPRVSSVVATVLVGCVVFGCGRFGPSFQPEPTGPFGPPTPPPALAGPLSLKVVYPPVDGAEAQAGESLARRARDEYRVQSRDSAFVFGSVGRADAEVLVNGHSASVYPSGGWIAWLPLPDDSVVQFDVVATAGPDTARMVVLAPIAGGGQRYDTKAWIDSLSFSPSGDRWLRPGEGVQLTLRATPGANVRALTSDGEVIRGRQTLLLRTVLWICLHLLAKHIAGNGGDDLVAVGF